SHHAPGDRLAQINWGTHPAAGYDTGEPVIEGPDWRSPIVRATSPRRHGYRPAPGLVLFPFSPEFVALAANLFGDVVDHIEVRGRAAHHLDTDHAVFDLVVEVDDLLGSVPGAPGDG